MKGHGLVQPGWDNPNCGQHTARPDDPFDGRRGPRATAGSPAGREKGGGAPALFGVARPKAAAAVDLQGQPPRNRPPWRSRRRWQLGPATTCRSATTRSVSVFEGTLLVVLQFLCFLLAEGFLVEQCLITCYE
jgi:hypothetical protein